ncbi:MAG TPA: hypothetical protein PK490_22865 [Prosthecobacter sp.]|nr:hypothetical protein [Prosthecobacter sp.]
MPPTAIWDSGQSWDTPGLVWSGGESNQPTTMNINNKVSAVLTDEQLANITAAIATISANLPFLIELTARMKQQYPTIGTERSGMLTVFTAAMQNHPQFVPAYVDMAELLKDVALWERMLTPLMQLRAQLALVEDTHHALGHDIYMPFLSFYHTLKDAARRNIPTAEELQGTLGSWFERSAAEPETPPATE